MSRETQGREKIKASEVKEVCSYQGEIETLPWGKSAFGGSEKPDSVINGRGMIGGKYRDENNGKKHNERGRGC